MENQWLRGRIRPEVEEVSNRDEVIATVVLRSQRHLEPRRHPADDRRAALGRAPPHSVEFPAPDFAKRSLRACWPEESTLTQNVSAARIAGQLVERRLGHSRTWGGSSDSAEND